jgi:tetratricopeptide (TPR) repeat protein
LVQASRHRHGARFIARVRGQYHLLRDEADKAVDSFDDAVRMAREVGFKDARAEAWLALARLRADEAFDARGDAVRLDHEPGRPALAVAELWQELGETERAIAAALRAHEWAVADGEPYVFRYELNRSRALLEGLGTEPPRVPEYDPTSDPPFDWEADVRKMIEELEARRETQTLRACP